MKAKQITEGSSLFLDLIRAVSAQMVVVGHGIGFCSVAMFPHSLNFPWIHHIAVVIFFILSGYLISNSVFYKLSISNNYSFKSFFIDRFSRIYSAFVPALLFVFFIDLVSKNISHEEYSYTNAFNIKTLIGNLFMLQDFPFFKYLNIKITSFGSARPFWTLAIEWWIYLWFGFLMIKILKKKPSIFSMVCFIFFSIVPVYNLFFWRGHGLTLFWLFGLFIGLAYDKYKTIQLSKFLKLGLIVLLLSVAGLRIGMTLEAYDPVFALLLSISLLIGMELCSSMLLNKQTSIAVKLIANYSYTLYLIHFSIYEFVLVHLKDKLSFSSLFLVGFFISNITALIIGYFTEIKLTNFVKEKLKMRFA